MPHAPQADHRMNWLLAALEPEDFVALEPHLEMVELTRGPDSAGSASATAERFFATLGKHTAWVGDAPGLVLGRIVCGLVNEAAFAIGEGVGSPDDVDAGIELGLNHPRGPVAWSELLGADHVAATIDGLHGHYREERYRAAPLLRRAATLGRGLRDHSASGPEA